MIHFRSENPFDLHHTQYENVWVLVRTLSAEYLISLWKNLLFNTCNTLVSKDPKILNQCILGVIELKPID